MPDRTELPNSIRTIFADAGWKPGRRITVPSVVPPQHPAHSVLAEFGGLTVAKNSLSFGYIEPDRTVLRWADLLQSQLIGVAEIQNGHAELYVDASGRWFFASCIHDAFAFEGVSLAEAMECELLGRRCMPMLRPDQSRVVMWGEEFRSDDPRVYRYR